MRTRQWIGIVPGMLAGIAGGVMLGNQAGVRGQTAANPFPSVSIPGIPARGNYCLWRINKSIIGPIQSQLGTPYRCESGRTTRSRTRITFRFDSVGGPDCDQPVAGFPPNCVLEATGSTLHRADGLAHFSGTFSLLNPSTRTTFFRGRMEVIGRVGTHQALGEKCDQDRHIEGWLVGAGVGNLSRYSLRATLAANLNNNLPNATALVIPECRVTGVVVKAP